MQDEKSGCLVIHGFGGGVYEIESLAKHLCYNGYIVSCPKLKGHTGNGKDMKSAGYKDWIASAEEEFLKLAEKTNNISIVGFSMGGLIAAHLACKHTIKSIVTINTPIYYWNIYRVVLNILEDFKNKEFISLRRYINAKKSSPLISMFNFLLLLKSAKSKLSHVKCPVLIIQTKDDDTTKLKSADYIYDNIGSVDKEIRLHEKGGHLVLMSPFKEKVIMDVDNFLSHT